MRFDHNWSRLLVATFRVLLSSVTAMSCAQLLGDIAVESQPAQSAGGLMPVEPGGVVNCEPGSTRCNDGVLQVCVRFEPSLPAGWLDQNDCGTPDLCSSGPPAICITPTCQAGEGSCSGATPRLCNAGQTGWDELPACESAAHCSTQPGECSNGAPCCLLEPCTPGELRCNEGRLEQCQPGLIGWLERTTCDTPELCQSGLAACGGVSASCACALPVCAEGEMRCSGSTLERCNLGRTGWDVASECASEALCQLGLSREPARCETPACSPGQFTCEGAALRSCRDDLTGLVDSEQCVGAAFCNAAAGRCEPAPCEPGERSCNGAQVQVCAVEQTGFEPSGPPCATADLCNDEDPGNVRCDPPACGVGQFECFGSNQLQVCNAGRTAFEPAAPPCLRPDLCSAIRRRCDFCFPGRQECTPNLTASRVCDLSGNFFGPETFCPLGCVGSNGQCQTCNVGDYVCSNGNLSRCNDGRSFTPLNRNSDCSNGQQVLCSNGQLIRNACPAGFFCGGTGQCLCNPGPAFCSGDALLVCTGTAIVQASQCQGQQGNILTTCENGQLLIDACDSAQDCQESSGSNCDDDDDDNGGGNGNGNGGGNDDDDDD